MKDDREEYCRRILDVELQKRGFAHRDWEIPKRDPPDRFLLLAGKRIAVEMTSTRHQTTAIDGGTIPSEQYDAEIVKLLTDFKARAIAAGLLHGTYCLSVFKPFASREFRSHRESLLQLLLGALEKLDNAPAGSRWEPPWQYMDTLDLWKVDPAGADILRSAAVCQGVFGAFNEPATILKDLAEGKRQKLQKANVVETPILVVLNTYDLLDGPGFREWAAAVPEIGFFEAIFLIDRFGGLCTELTNSVLLRPKTEAI
jgi:hypothetical protein